jgi:hypothetical protein
MRRQFDYVSKEVEGWPDPTPPREVLDDVCRICRTANPDPAVNAAMVRDWTRDELRAYAELIERISAAAPKDREDLGWTLLEILLKETGATLIGLFRVVDEELAGLASAKAG